MELAPFPIAMKEADRTQSPPSQDPVRARTHTAPHAWGRGQGQAAQSQPRGGRGGG